MEELEVEKMSKLSIEDRFIKSENALSKLREEFNYLLFTNSDLKTENKLINDELEEVKKIQSLNSLKMIQTSGEELKKCRILEKEVNQLKKEVDAEKSVNIEKVKPMGIYSVLHSSYKQMKGVQSVLNYMKKGATNTTDFNHLMRNVVKHPPYPDCTPFTLSAKETFVLRSTLHLSDGDMKKMKKFYQNHLGFDPLASRNAITDLRKEIDKSDNYEIQIVPKETGKKDSYDSVQITIKDLHKGISERIKDLYDNGLLLDSDDDLTLCLLGDKGSEETKICVSIENVANPNSPHNLLLIALYEGQDNEKELRNHALDVFSLWNDLSEICFSDKNGILISKKIKKKVIGDLKIISSYLGHQGQASLCACHLCELAWSNHGSKAMTLEMVDFTAPFILRTLESYARDAKTGRNGVIKGSSPLLNVQPVDFAIPTIHVLMGIFEKYFQSHINAQLNIMDRKDDSDSVTLKQQKKDLTNLIKRESEAKDHADSLNLAKEKAHSAATAYKLIQEKKLRLLKSPSLLCKSQICLIIHMPKKQKADDWITCSKCQNYFHFLCSSIFTAEMKASAARQKDWECNECKNKTPTDLFRFSMMQYSSLEVEVQVAYDNYRAIYEERMQLENILYRSTGENRQKMEQLLTKMGCDAKTWYQSYCGNQVRIILRPENVNQIFSILPNTETNRKAKMAMIGLSEIMSFSNNQYYTDQDIDIIEDILQRFLFNMKSAFPRETLIPKLHLLAFHLIPYMRRHHSWGRTSEQGIEHMHVHYNNLKRLFFPIKQLTLRATLILQELTIKNWLFDTGVWIE
ncbi:hypothetical protein B9Z55_009131 [Caenorhabditis nigoni]|uniref:Zinc finger PHD-type domain-containing protein n=2 Tax=Caenorhabditis nigoni TaxID=1611254 RepID=A0A2G5UQM9_9PELO|nr:hypothetical protein B9Z55_009131 [Caenorhabditis nigoni]